MSAIMKRDFQSYFISPIGYIFCGVFVLLVNAMFFINNIYDMNSDVRPVFVFMLNTLIYLVPILTMRSFSEEFKAKTDQLLMTAPVKISEIVAGKYFAAMGVFLVALAPSLMHWGIVAIYGTPESWVIIGNYVAVILVASAFVSIGMFASSLTENQLISAVICLAFLIATQLLDLLSMAGGILADIGTYLSFFARFQNGFAMGVFSVADLVFYFSVTLIFLFLTTRVLEKKRYS